MNCKECGKTIDQPYVKGMCQICYRYFKKGGKIHPLPQPGTIAHDERGYVICHICGKAYVVLGIHVNECHNMTIAEYKEKFGLCVSAKTTEAHCSQVKHDNAIQHGMDKRLPEIGKFSRFKKGQIGTMAGKHRRLQEMINKRNQKLKEE